MEIRSLRYFLAVAEEGSFRRAARRAGVSQPAVSQGIGLLEKELGARLFDRGFRAASLTPDGTRFLDPARRVLADFDGLPQMLDRSRGVVRGRLEIGTTDAASIYVLPKVYRAFRRLHPHAELSVRVEGTGSLLSQLRAGAIEIALVHLSVGARETPIPERGLLAEPLFREDLLFLVSGKSPLAGRGRVNLADLADQPFITFKTESITRHAVETLFRDRGLTLQVAMEISSPEAIKKLVEVGLGVSILPSRSVRSEVRSGSLVPLSVPDAKLSRVLGLVRDARRTPSVTASAFHELAERIRNVPKLPTT
jgi:DNA-binding transcriptional LysR family regulator